MQLGSYNIYDLIETAGEDAVQGILSQFLCPRNAEIENFVRCKAIDLAKRKITVTYLIMDEYGTVAAAYALTHKAITVARPTISSTVRKRLSRYSHYDKATDTYTASAFLIAQFGKNYADDAPEIAGDYIMERALRTVADAQRMIGGGVVYLECEENIPKLREFYANEHNKFVEFDRRQADDGIMYLQMMRII